MGVIEVQEANRVLCFYYAAMHYAFCGGRREGHDPVRLSYLTPVFSLDYPILTPNLKLTDTENGMRKRSIDIVLIGCVCVILLRLLGCSGDDKTTNPVDTMKLSGVVSANENFGFKLLADLHKRDSDKNIFISPLSVSIALTMAYNGAAGETQRAMAKVLEIEGMDLQTINRANAQLREDLENPDAKVELAIANSIWAREDVEFNADFLDRNRVFFDAQIATLNFSNPQAPGRINQWVDTNTKGKIQKIMDQIPPNVVMFLINAVYFKGRWQVEFDKSETRDGVFHLSDGTEKQVPMMRREGGYPYFLGENFEAVSLSYGEERVSMYVFLPAPDANLNGFVERLNAENWANWLPQFREVRDDSVIVMPRFKLEYEVILNDALKALGMDIAFGGGANFENLAPRGLFISEVKHKTFVEVNEEGTEAAAVTVVSMAKSSPPTFIVDRPFFFAIRDNQTGAMLFMGIVIEPM